jgi:intracellular septation protein
MTDKTYPSWLPATLDYAPLLIFFAAFKMLGVFGGTAVFMAAITVAVIIAKVKIGRVSPMMWMSAILVVGFGGLTIYLHDQKFIQIKPTIFYLLLSALLFGGLLRGKSLLKSVFEYGYAGLSDTGWRLFSRNWAWFFLGMAVFNEIVRANFDFDMWLKIKIWGLTGLSVLFTMANIPMLMKHGLGEEAEPKPAE